MKNKNDAMKCGECPLRAQLNAPGEECLLLRRPWLHYAVEPDDDCLITKMNYIRLRIMENGLTDVLLEYLSKTIESIDIADPAVQAEILKRM